MSDSRERQSRRKDLHPESSRDEADNLTTLGGSARVAAPHLTLHSGVVDLDRQIYLNLNGRELFNACSVNRYTSVVCDDSFWATKARIEFGDSVEGDNRALYVALYPLDSAQRLQWASGRGHIDMVSFMLLGGADVHANYEMALRMAARNGHVKVVRLLVARGADICEWNNSALALAALNGHLEVVEYLVEQGADIHAANEHAIRVASADLHLTIVEYLATRGTDTRAI